MKLFVLIPTRRIRKAILLTSRQSSYVMSAADLLEPPLRPEFVWRVERKLRDRGMSNVCDSLVANLIDSAYAQSCMEFACDD